MKIQPHHRLRRFRCAPTVLALAAAGLFAATAQAQMATQTPEPMTPQPTTAQQAGPGIGYGSTSNERYAQAGNSPNRSAMGGSNYGTGSEYSLLPFTRRGYVGVNVGKPQFQTGCGAGAFSCDDSEVSGYFYTGGLATEWLGVELGYFNSGKADRAGGSARAQAINLGAVLRAPLGSFNAFIKGGGLYGEMRVSADALSGVPTGTKRGWGPWYGAGIGFDLTPQSGVVLEWNRRGFRSVSGGGRNDMDTTSVGYVHRF